MPQSLRDIYFFQGSLFGDLMAKTVVRGALSNRERKTRKTGISPAALERMRAAIETRKAPTDRDERPGRTSEPASSELSARKDASPFETPLAKLGLPKRTRMFRSLKAFEELGHYTKALGNKTRSMALADMTEQLSQKLVKAAESGNITDVKSLIDQGADVNFKHTSGDTPLHIAIRAGNVPVAKQLIFKGALTNAANSNGETPLLLAVMHDHAGLARYLHEEHEAALNVKDSKGWTLLHHVAHNGNMALARYLAERSAGGFNKRNADGHTPLELAQRAGNKDLVKFFRERTGGQEKAGKGNPGKLKEAA